MDRELKLIMNCYFQSTGRLLFWQRDEAMQVLEDKILEFLLTVMGKIQYLESCKALLDEVAPMQTISDSAVLKLSDSLVDRNLVSYFDLKADALRRYEIAQNQMFDMDILLMDNRQSVIDGDPGALALGACLSWLGLDPESSPAAALRYWTVLAYTGDRFAMQALQYAYARQGDESNAQLWEQILQIFCETDRLFTITVPAHFLNELRQDAVDTAQVILAVRRKCADDNQELLPIPLLQYAIDSHEDVATKLQNLYAPPETYHTMLARQTHKDPKPVGFDI